MIARSMRRLLLLCIAFGLAACRADPAATPATTAPPLAAARTPGPGVHDHTPHHGGVVAMLGMIHLEAVAAPDGHLRLFLTDLYRRPLPLSGVAGSVTLHLRDSRPTLPLAVGDEALEASGPPLAGEVLAAFALRRDGEPLEVNFMLPVANGGAADSGAAGIPLGGCIAPAATPGVVAPRCMLSFPRPIAALAAAPAADGERLVVAVVDLGLSSWRLPSGSFAAGFAPQPPVVIAVPEPPHPEAPNAIVTRPDGGEIAVALENRLIIYDADGGQVRRALDGPGGIIRAAAWTPDGSALLVTTFYHPQAVLLDATDGHALHRYPVAREGAAVAVAPDGRSIAVGSETGAIALFDRAADVPLRTLDGGRGPVRALVFAGDAILATGDDGVVRGFDIASGAPRFAQNVGATIHQLALSPEGHHVAAAGNGGTVRVLAVADGRIVATLPATGPQVLALTWSGATIASGDVEGHVALWNAPLQ
ncbi:MAG: hypothetical protein ABI629_10905 [bacterium]